MEKRERRYFPEVFKREAAECVDARRLSIADVATKLGVHEPQLSRWRRQFGEAGAGSARCIITQRKANPRLSWQPRMRG